MGTCVFIYCATYSFLPILKKKKHTKKIALISKSANRNCGFFSLGYLAVSRQSAIPSPPDTFSRSYTCSEFILFTFFFVTFPHVLSPSLWILFENNALF